MSAEFTTDIHAIVNERSDGVCEVCGAARAWDKHHRLPRRAGSTRRPEVGLASNCLNCCRDCHRLVESHRNLATLLGWLVPSGFDPASQPVLRRGEWVRLGADGTVEAA